MSRMTDLLTLRLRRSDTHTKMAALAEETTNGKLTSFSGVFSVKELKESDKASIASLLDRYQTGEQDLNQDLSNLCAITSEVQAINNQAVILHGERIKKAQIILKQYKEGAFTAWLVATYGNRQTPYNLLQYYEFYMAVPTEMRSQVESMPRQAIYTLASREGDLSDKKRIVETYRGESKNEVLTKIREQFPLDEDDRRRSNEGENAILLLRKLCLALERQRTTFSIEQKKTLSSLIEKVQEHIDNASTTSVR